MNTGSASRPFSKSVVFGALVLSLVACAPARAPLVSRARSLPGTDGRPHALVGGGLTVLEFFSAHCPCQEAHDERLRAIAAAYAPRGVAFFAIDSEVEGTMDRDRAEAAKRGLPFPILVDAGGTVAGELGAEYATYVVVLDGGGNVVFRGGIDSDKRNLHDDAEPYLRDAIDDALAGRPVRRPEAKVLGCALLLR